MKQTTIQNASVQVQQFPDGSRALVVQNGVHIPVGQDEDGNVEMMVVPTDVTVIPVDKDTANALSKDLHVSDVIVAPANALPRAK